MSILIDTNVLLRSAEPTHLQHLVAVRAVDILLNRGEEVSLVPQVLYEFWSVATRPLKLNGLGWSTAATELELQRLYGLFTLKDDVAGIFSRWKTLVAAHDVKGKNSHDARLVAAMLQHGQTTLLTFNRADFMRFTSIAMLTPDDVVGATP